MLNFEGSILAWVRTLQCHPLMYDSYLRLLTTSMVHANQTHEGYPLVTGPNHDEPTKRVHVFAEKWLIQGDGYEPVVYKNGLQC